MTSKNFNGIQQSLGRVGKLILKTRAYRFLRSDIDQVIDICNRAAAGDLEARIRNVGKKSKFAKMCIAINRALDTSDAFTREASAAMENCSQDRYHRPILLRGLQGSFLKSAQTINSAAAQMKVHSDNLQFVVTQAAETANSVHTVAAACEELNATTTEISAQTSDAAGSAREVSKQLTEMKVNFDRLQAAVTKIDGVVGLLNSVALQTQLLGLNAAIEAAHAGEVGAGFAVVAQEVKSLSDDTRKAAEQIVAELNDIKHSAHAAGSALATVTSTIVKVEESTDAIDLSVREQVKAAGSISSNIVSVSEKSEEIALRIKGSRAGG